MKKEKTRERESKCVCVCVCLIPGWRNEREKEEEKRRREKYKYLKKKVYSVWVLWHINLCKVSWRQILFIPIFWILHRHNTYTTIHIYMRKHSQHNNNERTHFFRKIYLSHFIRKVCERVVCERWVGDWTNCNILTPSSFVFISTSFSFCWAAQSGVVRAHSPLLGADSHDSISSPTELPVEPGYIIVWHPPASCERRICTEFNPSTVKPIS